MRNAIVVVAIVGAIVIALLDVAAYLAVNGGVNLLPLGLVIVGLLLVLAGIARRPKRVIDPRDVMTLVRLSLQAGSSGSTYRGLTSPTYPTSEYRAAGSSPVLCMGERPALETVPSTHISLTHWAWCQKPDFKGSISDSYRYLRTMAADLWAVWRMMARSLASVMAAEVANPARREWKE
jgi:hypothetical protein